MVNELLTKRFLCCQETFGVLSLSCPLSVGGEGNEARESWEQDELST